MRISPIPFFSAISNRIDIIEADKLAGSVAKITHHHPLGYIPAALTSHIIYRLIQDYQPKRNSFKIYVQEGMEKVKELYSYSKTTLRNMSELIDKAFKLSQNNQNDADNIKKIGEGWAAEETLAIAIYCVNRYFDNFEKGIIASVNHDGDSDSTGAITGNIIGAITGYEAIPQFYKDDLELQDIILKIANGILLDNNAESTMIPLNIFND